MSFQHLAFVALLSIGLPAAADTSAPFDAARAFGARQSVSHLSLSPDGATVAYIAPARGQGATLFTLSLAKGSVPRAALAVDGKPDRLEGCDWVSNERLVCLVYGLNSQLLDILPLTRLIAINADGTNPQILSTKDNEHSRGIQLGGGSIIDWLPEEDSAVLMTRVYIPDDHLGTRIANTARGLGVDRIDTRTLKATTIEPPRADVVNYISDGHGVVRIMGMRGKRIDGGLDTGLINYLYRTQGSREWVKLGSYDEVSGQGFDPQAVDIDRNVALGFKKVDGRRALYSVALDGSFREELVYGRPDVDVDDLIRIGRRKRVVGATYVTTERSAEFFDPQIAQITASLAKALPGRPGVRITDSSVDESKLLVFAGSDVDPGVYYLFDRKSRHLETFLVVRSELEGIKLATVTAVRYPASDGTMVPGYLTLPPGMENTKGLPAIVMPHGGPGSRDEWGFDYLSQFYAARGYAVLQPNFRGSTGYGDSWMLQGGFRSWPTTIGDVLDGGRWLVSQGIADPSKIGIVGWSYGGYAALQSAVVAPGLFKAVVAIAPVTDLEHLKEEHRHWSDFKLVSDFVGDGPQVHDGSPAQNAGRIKVPVLLFHGAMDRNVSVAQSEMMAASLASAGVPHELVTWRDLDHYLEDSAARAEMLRKSDDFLRQALGLNPVSARTGN